jgi:hypothetical protein
MRRFIFSALVAAALTFAAGRAQAQFVQPNYNPNAVYNQGASTPNYQPNVFNNQGAYTPNYNPNVVNNQAPFAYGPHLSNWYSPTWYRSWSGGHHGWSNTGWHHNGHWGGGWYYHR